ncbi:MAG: RNA polymerase sigma factor [Saccharofermentanales bacterium]
MLIYYLSLIETDDDKDKFERLYNQYKRLMFYRARQILDDDFLAEDAVHDAFIKIIACLDKIDENSCHRTKGFMVIVVESTSKNLYNRRKKDAEVLVGDFDARESDRGDVADEVLDQLSVEAVVAKIDLLPGIYKEVLLLRFVHELNDKDIAKLLSLRPEAVRKRLERARRKIGELCRQEMDT